MAMQKLPCPTVLRLLLRYEPDTGRLFWRRRSRSWFRSPGSSRAWNTKYAERETFLNKNGNGYLTAYVLNANVVSQRVVMTILTGEWPKLDVDHIDGNRTNNQAANLRLATRSENLRNAGSRRGSRSQYCGVSWDKGRNLWQAGCNDHAGKRRALGRFADERAAATAYDAAARLWHGDFARLNFP